ncbi:hypothetical protein ACKC9G_07860 [Pokkaliibacter sp. CJK22405]|uniref:hypothetical protein n=1 Tax=Pokkaliibacter sp. CJK22405 TaxID=3384615 RepID=UPI003984A2ED
MTDTSISLNSKFSDLLRKVDGSAIRRKALIDLALDTTTLTKSQATGFVARNIHSLKRQQLIEASGKRPERIYRITPTLAKRLGLDTLSKGFGEAPGVMPQDNQEILLEETKTAAELKIVQSEIKAYQDFLEKFPASRTPILILLDKSKEHESLLNGRLNALKKISKIVFNIR